MNKTYKVIFNHVLGRFVVVSEIASRIQRGGIKAVSVAAAAVLAVGLGMGAASADELPVHDWDTGNRSTAIGSGSTSASGKDSFAMGNDAHASGKKSTAVGNNVEAAGDGSSALGTGVTVTGDDSIGVGHNVNVTNDSSVGIGNEVSSSGQSSIAIGENAKVTDSDGVAIGHGAEATENDASALGHGSHAYGEESTSLGKGTTADANATLAGGADASAMQGSDVAMGDSAYADAGSGTAVGTKSHVEGASGAAFGDRATVTKDAKNGTALGEESYVNNLDATASGSRSRATGERSTANGTESEASGEESSAFGSHAEATAERSVAMGGGADKDNAAKADARDSVAVGSGSRANDEGSVAIGGGGADKGASATGENAVSVGKQSSVKGADGTALGYDTHVDAASGTAFGTGANVTAEKGTALGANSSVSAEGGVALGSGSVADRDPGMLGYVPPTGRKIDESSSTWTATGAAVSVGDAEKGITRQITNVAAGTEDTDLANVAQLKQAMTHYYSVNTTPEIDNEGKNNNNYLNEAAYIDPNATYAMAAGVGVRATNRAATVFGSFAEANGTGSIALGALKDGEIQYTEGDEENGVQPELIHTVVHGANGISIGSYTQVYSGNGIGMGTGTNVYNADSVGIGREVNAWGETTTAVGTESQAGTRASAYGYKANAYSDDATAVGSGAGAAASATAIGNGNNESYSPGGAHAPGSTVVGMNAIVFGKFDNNNIEGTNSTAIGAYARAGTQNAISGEHNATSIGAWSKATGENAISVGVQEEKGTGEASFSDGGAFGNNSIAIGIGAKAVGENSVYIGANNRGRAVNNSRSVAVGFSPNVSGMDSVMIGNGSITGGEGVNDRYAVGIGNRATTYRDYAVAIGGGVGNESFDLNNDGPYTKAVGPSAVAIGFIAVAGSNGSSDDSVAVGVRATATGYRSVAIGSAGIVEETDRYGAVTKKIVSNSYPVASSSYATAVGLNAQATNSYTTAAGRNSGAHGSYATAVGWGALASGNQAVAFGYGSNANKENTIAIGYQSVASGTDNIAIGTNNTSGGDYHSNTIAIGHIANPQSNRAIAIGYLANAGEGSGTENAVAIGVTDSSMDVSRYYASSGQPRLMASRANAIAIGTNPLAGENAISIGAIGQAVDVGALAIGVETNAYDDNATVVGNLAIAGYQDIAFGYTAKATGTENVAVGTLTEAGGNASHTVAIGANARALAQNDVVAIGHDAQAGGAGEHGVAIGTIDRGKPFNDGNNPLNAYGEDSVALGTNALAGTRNVSIGLGSQAVSDTDNVAIGYRANASADSAVVIGTELQGVYASTVAIGEKNNAYDTDAVVIGYDLGADEKAVSIGRQVNAYGVNAVALGYSDYVNSYGNSRGVNKSSVSVGELNNVYQEKATVVGKNSDGGGENAVVVGNQSAVRSTRGVVIGNSSEVTAHYTLVDPDTDSWAASDTTDGVVVGGSSKVQSNYGVLVGNSSTVTGDYSISVGKENNVYGEKSGAFGYQGLVEGDASYAVGNNTHIPTYDSFVLGNSTEVQVAGGVAIGTGSIANRGSYGYDDAPGYALPDHEPPEREARTSTWVPTASAISVGSGSYDGDGNYTAEQTRRITGVAAGLRDTDAVNVAQLKLFELMIPGFTTGDNVDIVPDDPDDPDNNKHRISAWKTLIRSDDRSVKVVENYDEANRRYDYDLSVKYRIDPTTDENGNKRFDITNDNNDVVDGYFTDTDTTYTMDGPVHEEDGDHYVFKDGDGNPAGEFVDTNTNTSVEGDAGSAPILDVKMTAGAQPEEGLGPEYTITIDEEALRAEYEGKLFDNNTEYELNGSSKAGAEKNSTDYTIALINTDSDSDAGSYVHTDTDTTYTVSDRYEDPERSAASKSYQGSYDLVDSHGSNVGTIHDTDTQYELKRVGDDRGGYHFELRDSDGNTTGRIDLDGATVIESEGQNYAGDFGSVDDFYEGPRGMTKLTGGDMTGRKASDFSTETNIGVFAEAGEEGKEGSLNIRLAKDLKGLDSMQVNEKIIVGAQKGKQVIIDEDGIEIEGGPTIKREHVDMGGNQIHNVGKGTASDDMVNLSQLQEMGDTINNSLNHLAGRIEDVDDRANAGVATALATAALPQVYVPGKNMTAIGAASYRGENGVAFGFSSISDNGKWIVKGSATANTESHLGANVGLGYLLW